MLLLDWLFPPRCVQCRQISAWLCVSCEKQFFSGLDNEVYFQAVAGLNGAFITCRDQSRILAKLLYAWKYRLWLGAAGRLQDLLANAFCTVFGTTDSILCVPIPVHKQKLRDRGFNQAQELLLNLSKVSNITIADLIIRQKNTRSQVGLTKIERQENLLNAFRINQHVLNNLWLHYTVVLVDDILTSGTTMLECAEILRSVGFKNIYALVLHRGTK